MKTFREQLRYYGLKNKNRRRKKKKSPPPKPLPVGETSSEEENVQHDFTRNRFIGEKCRSQLDELSMHYKNDIFGNTLPQRSIHDLPSGIVYSSGSSLTNSFLERFRQYEEPIREGFVEQLYREIVEEVVEDNVFLEKEFYPINQKQKKRIDDVLYKGYADDIIFDRYNVKMTREKMRCLRDGVWLNDEVMNFYVNLMRDRNERAHPHFPNPVKRKYCKEIFNKRKQGTLPQLPPKRRTRANSIPNSYFFSTFFYFKLCQQFRYNHKHVARWTRTADLFLYDKVIIPVHLGAHWVCVVVNFRNKRFEYYDSLYNPRKGEEVLMNIKRYMEDEYLDKMKVRTTMFDGYQYLYASNAPQQRNGFDCGVFALKFANFLSQDLPLCFGQNHMRFFRKKIGVEILNCFMM